MRNESITIDEAIEEIGLGRFQYKLLAICGAGWAADAIEVIIISFVIPAVIEEWSLTVAPAGGIVLGVVVGLSTNFLIVSVIPTELYLSAIIAVLGSALAIRAAGASASAGGGAGFAGWVPRTFHAYFLVTGMVAGIFLQRPFLLLVSVVMAALTEMIWRSTW